MQRLPDAVTVPETLAAALIERARRAGPHEICGILSGTRSGVAEHDHPISNRAARAHDRFEMDTAEQIALFRDLREAQRHQVAIYHSHPLGPPCPSVHDRAGHGYPRVPALIVAPCANGPKLAAWWLTPDDARPCPLVIGSFFVESPLCPPTQ
ncbi:M67 family metallopeptidase [Salinisphaera sp.]|uniref:M67 family metallopeptidase n=1 Tax=Salinisphaera sp. TaxID=1914330 RepID=UPI0025CCBD5D|nr:M67 family metallopeptidase [Salinisphaera sp.]